MDFVRRDAEQEKKKENIHKIHKISLASRRKYIHKIYKTSLAVKKVIIRSILQEFPFFLKILKKFIYLLIYSKQ